MTIRGECLRVLWGVTLPSVDQHRIDADRVQAHTLGMGTLYYGDSLFCVLNLLLDMVFGQNIDSQMQFRHACLHNG